MAYRLPTSQYDGSVLEKPISVEVSGSRVGERRDREGLKDSLLEAASKIGSNGMCYVLVLPVPRLPAWHSDENAILALYDLDVMHDKTVVESHRHVRLQLSFGRDLADAYIRDLHGCDSPCERA